MASNIYTISPVINGGSFDTNVHNSLRKAANAYSNREIPRDVVLRSLKNLERASHLLSFLSKPAVVILTGVVCVAICFGLGIAAGAMIPLAAVVSLRFFSIIFSLVGTGIIGIGIRFSFSNELGNISNSYANRAQEAKGYIEYIETHANITHVKV